MTNIALPQLSTALHATTGQLQWIASAFTLVAGVGMLPGLLTDPGQRARAVMIWTAASAVGLPLGPVIGGLLLDHFWWGAVFLPNAGLALAGVAAVAVFVPENGGAPAR